jgi:hypothetical protein
VPRQFRPCVPPLRNRPLVPARTAAVPSTTRCTPHR